MADEAVVLLAEDREDDIFLIKQAFSRAGITNPLQVVQSGEETIAYLAGEGKYSNRAEYPLPALLLLDLKMPKANGFQVLEWLRQQPDFGRLSVAIMTSSDHDPHISRAYQLGADSYLRKPPDAMALLALVQRLHAYWMIVNEPASLAVA